MPSASTRWTSGALSASDPLTVDLSTTTDSTIGIGWYTNRTILTAQPGQAANFDNVVGGAGGDAITGNAADNLLSGGDGNDIIYGMDGNDTLEGGGGNDTLDAGAGDNTYLFGDNWGSDTVVEPQPSAGADTWTSRRSPPTPVHRGRRHQRVRRSGRHGHSVGDNIESLIGGMVNDTFTFVGRRSWPADKA